MATAYKGKCVFGLSCATLIYPLSAYPGMGMIAQGGASCGFEGGRKGACSVRRGGMKQPGQNGLDETHPGSLRLKVSAF